MFIWVLLWAGTLSMALQSCRKEESQEKPPNVVLFLVDDLGWADVGYNGSSFYETPSIDKFAANAVQFNNAYAAAHVCSPTRASLLTGKYPARLDLTDWLPGRKDFEFQKLTNVQINQHLPFEEQTLAESLKRHGYSTAIFGKWHLGEDPSGPLSHGFDKQVPDWNKGWPLSYTHPFKLDSLESKEGDYLTDRLTDEALAYIEEKKDAPFFLYFSHFSVHDPIKGDPKLVEKYRRKKQSQEMDGNPGYILEGNPDSMQSFTQKERDSLMELPEYQGYGILPNQMVKIKQKQDNVEFAAMVESTDTSFGRVIAKLEELGLSENTIVIFYSDNGGMSAANYFNPDRKIPETRLDKAFSTSNLPLRGAKGWLYEGGIRVPLIIKWPEGKVGSNQVPVTSPDLFPTILEMAGFPLEPENHKDGTSLVPLLKGNDHLDREAIFWHFPHYSNHGMQSPGGAVISGDFKLLEYYENNTVQLFNLKDDIGEKHELSMELPDKTKELRQMLKEWRIEVKADMMEENPNYQPFKQ